MHLSLLRTGLISLGVSIFISIFKKFQRIHFKSVFIDFLTFYHHKGNYSCIVNDFNLSGFYVPFPGTQARCRGLLGLDPRPGITCPSRASSYTCGGCTRLGVRLHLLCAQSVLTCRSKIQSRSFATSLASSTRVT